MSDFTKENISDLLFQNVDSIVIVDAQKGSYQAVKRTGLFEKIIQDTGSYNDLLKRLWFNINNSSNQISMDYQVFVPMLGKFSGKYSNKINFLYEDVIHCVQIAIYPLDTQNTQYLFLLDELDNSEYIRDFAANNKVDTIKNSYLFSMYVDLIKDTTHGINVTEISNDSMNYAVSYSTWRHTIVNMIEPDDQSLFLKRTSPEYLKANLLPGKTTSFDCQMKNLEGDYIWVKLIFSRSNTTNEDDFRFVYMVQNIHEESMELFETLKKYENLASKDTLTNIYNHGRIETEIVNAIESLKITASPISIMMFDIDYFKKVNDVYGHSVGDNVLKQFVKIICDFFEPYNTKIGRWGGEEFVCVCYDNTFDNVKKLAEEVREKIESESFDSVVKVTCSIGLTELQPNDTPLVAFNRVDSAMYQAKNNGRNQVVIK